MKHTHTFYRSGTSSVVMNIEDVTGLRTDLYSLEQKQPNLPKWPVSLAKTRMRQYVLVVWWELKNLWLIG